MRNERKIFVLLFLLCCVIAQAQNQWVWMKGSNVPNSPGNYGAMGFPSAANEPPARYEAAEWTDQQGNFWMYGGFDFQTNNTFNDLWKYNPATNMWTWISGSNTPNQPAVYGVQTVPSPLNTPGGRKYAMTTWADNNGNLWLMGGFGPSGILNDLWKYNIATNMWTWMHGTNTAFPAGVYGTMGVPNPANMPGYRCETSTTWVDNSGDLWLFGGQSNGLMNDLWRYNIATNTWTWMSGSQFGYPPAVYGTQGVAAPGNQPSGRVVYASWKDLSGDLWLFGGNDSSFFTGGGCRNDLWRYNIASGLWTWMSGSNLLNQPGVYGTQCVPSVNNVPGARIETRSRWVDDCGNFWLFAGSKTFSGSQPHNDLWKYNPQTNEWTWVNGSQSTLQTGVYGVQNVPNAANHPGARLGAVAWKNAQGLWLFGGSYSATSFLNDLWLYLPDRPTANFTASPTSGCAPLTVQFTDSSSPNCTDIGSWAWDFGDPLSGGNNVSALQNPSHTFNAQGTYTVQLIVTSCLGRSDTSTTVITTNLGLNLSTSSTPSGCSSSTGSATVNVSNGSAPFTYSWSSGGNAATENNLAAGNYTITVTDVNGCSGTQTVAVASGGSLSSTVSAQTDVACNGGNNGSATVNPAGGTGPYSYAWLPSGGNSATATNLSAGTYTVTITDAGSCSTTQTLTITQPQPLALSTSAVSASCGSNNGSATVNPGGGTGPYTYTWSPSGGNNATANNLAGGTYTVNVSDANGCTAMASVVVGSSSALSSSITAQTDVLCNGGSNGSATVNPGGGAGPYLYAWLPSGGSNASANNLGAGTYTVTITDANNCTSSSTVSITQPPAMTLAANGNSTICTGANDTLIASAGGGAGGFSYTWYPGTLNGDTAIVSPAANTTYTVTATDANGCSASQTITVTVNQPVTISASGATTICGGQNAPLSANASNGGPYQWSTGATTANDTVTPAITTTYYVSTWDACANAFVTDSVQVTVAPPPVVLFSNSPMSGCSPLIVPFTDQSTVTTGTITGWLWDFGDGNNSTQQSPTHTYTTPGTYTVTLTVTSSNGCTATYVSPNVITVYPDPWAAFGIQGTPISLMNPTAGFTDLSTGAATWAWDFGDGGNSTQQNPVHTYSDTGLYIVTLVITNSYGCIDSAISEVQVTEDFTFYVPNTFTPNGDGINEDFNGKGTGIKDYHLMVFDRWGMLIFQSNSLTLNWDGRFKSRPVQEDVYVYKIELHDVFDREHQYIGHVSVVR